MSIFATLQNSLSITDNVYTMRLRSRIDVKTFRRLKHIEHK